MALYRLNQVVFNNIVNITKSAGIRCVSTTTVRPLKEIKVEQNADTLLISGQIVDSARKPYLVKELTAEPTANQKKFCPKCTLGLDIKHTDVLILSQYVRSDGCMLPQRITGLCRVQQKRIGTLVTMAQKAGLMANLAPANSKRDPTKRYAWKKYNKYYDESTIKLRNRIID